MDKLTVGKRMTPNPYTIGIEQPISAARRIMREHRVRHLPCLSAGRIVGIVTERDLHLIESLRDVDPEQVLVEEAMTPDPYVVPSSASLEWVVTEMANHKYGSTVVVDGSTVVGIFTTVDALGVLQVLLAQARRGHSLPEAGPTVE